MAEPSGTPRVSRVSSVTLQIVNSIGTLIRQLIIGVPCVGLGVYWIYDEINHIAPGDEIHAKHIYMAAGLILIGGIAINPPFGDQVKAFVIQFFPTGVPLIGGRRETDPPKPDSINGSSGSNPQ